MAVDLVEEFDVSIQHVAIKFNVSLRPSSITNDKFLVATDEATPVDINDPFETIDLGDPEQWNPVARLLRLTWKDDILDPVTAYTFTITGLLNVLGQEIDDWVGGFTTGDTVNTATDGLPPDPDPVTIVDYSIVSNVFDELVLTTANTIFQVESTDPILGDYYLPPDYHDGRVEITFTDEPALISVMDGIRAQKRLLSRGPSRWEDVDVNISKSNRVVYVDFPSIDHYPEAATPATETVYYTDGYSYFDTNYKYRIILSGDIHT